jgi:hypothetical protein
VLVGGGVEEFVLAGEVKRPVGVEVAVVVQGPEFEDGLGALEAPATAGDVESVAHDVAAGAFRSRRWRSASPPTGRCRSGADRGAR